MTQPIWITEQDVVVLLDLGEAIAALEAALREEARGTTVNMPKTLLQYGIAGEGKGSPARSNRARVRDQSEGGGPTPFRAPRPCPRCA
jgi:hypothetical protein